jgi:signal transduction histidine kinase
MSEFTVKKTVFVVMFFYLYSLNALSQSKVKNIVIFCSFSSNIPAYQVFLDGFRRSISETLDQPSNIIIEYLDVGRSENEEYARYIIDMYNSKFKENKIDLLVAIGPGIIPVLEKYDLDALKTSPIINIDIDYPGRKPSRYLNKMNSLEVILDINCSRTIRKAFELFPDHADVYVISGVSVTDKYLTSTVEKSIKEFEPVHNFAFISGLTIDSTIRFVKKIPASSLVLVASYLLDKNNIPFSTPEVINLISHYCKAPVLPITDSFVRNEGGIGGFLYSYRNVGMEVGRISQKILEGSSPNDLKIDTQRFYQNIYNWQELKKWHLLNSSAIPKNSIFLYQEISFFSRYKWYFIGFLIFIFTQSLMIIYLFRLNKRQKGITAKMMETENMHRELIRIDRLAKMTELTAALSHELNQPLTAILYSAQAGKRFLQSGKLDQKLSEEIFDNIIEDDKRAGGIISSVKSLMKLEFREKEKINLNSLILETNDIIHSDAIRQRIKVMIHLNGEPVYVHGDKVQLQQVLLNILRNASNAMEDNASDNKTLEIYMQTGRGSVTVSVRDSGPGIDNAVIKKLFKPFVTTSPTGFGIGLALSRSIIEKHKGEIWAKNLEKGGAEFSFRLNTI